MFSTPPNQVELRAGKSIARVSSLSAAITFLEIDGVVAVAQVTKEAILNAFASVVCAPWPNRIANGKWNGVQFPGNDPHGNALHGLVFDKEFEQVSNSENSASYRCHLAPSANYNFELEIQVEYVLTDDGLEVTYGAVNLGNQKAPYGVAAHPYFDVQPGSTFDIPAKKQSINNEIQIPTGTRDVTESHFVFDDAILDDCYSELTGDFVISHPDGSSVTIWQGSDFKYLMVYTGHQMAKYGFPNAGLAVEPQTCPANAFNTGEDLIWLEPGHHWQSRWGVTAKGAA